MDTNRQQLTLKIPAIIIWIIVVLCLLPFLLALLGIDFASHPHELNAALTGKMTHAELTTAVYESVSGAFIHTMLEWSALNVAVFTLVLALIHYRMVKDIAIPVICLALFFSGILDAFHTLAADQLIASQAPINDLIAFTWAVARVFNAGIMIVCVGLFTVKGVPLLRRIPLSLLLFTTIVLMLIAYSLISYMSNSPVLPKTLFPNAFISRPYDVVPLVFYLFSFAFLYPRFYKLHPGPFAQSLILMAFVGMSSELYMSFGSKSLFDSNFYIAHFLKLLSYILPLIGLLVDYVQTYRTVHATQIQLVEQTEELSQLAHHDYLTGLNNRAAFEKSLEHEIQRATRFDLNFALLFIDLDNFKRINDDLGHNIGDIYLREVANRLKRCVRETDTIARIGGDEFALILEGIEHKRQAGIVAKKIFTEFEKEYAIGNRTVTINGSIGIACFPEAGSSVTQLCKHADIAMYQAKAHGKRQWQYFTAELKEQFGRRLSLENALMTALEKGEFYVEYQPQYNIVDNVIIGAEILLRWDSPTLGLISPDVFVPLAEEMGLISSIGSWVLEKACLQLKEWQPMQVNKGIAFDMGINISTKQLLDRSFMHTLKTLIAQYKFDPHDIVIELTETAIMSARQMLENLNEIAELGIRVAIDDFGTGYSSLSYLRELPIQIVKIDKSFLENVLHDASAEKIVRSIIAMVKNLDLEIVAEGVENQVQKQFLIDNGCFIAQGFYLGKPMNAVKFSELLMNSQSATKG